MCDPGTIGIALATAGAGYAGYKGVKAVKGALGGGGAPTPEPQRVLPGAATEVAPELARDRLRQRARLAYNFDRTNLTKGQAALPTGAPKQLLGS